MLADMAADAINTAMPEFNNQTISRTHPIVQQTVKDYTGMT